MRRTLSRIIQPILIVLLVGLSNLQAEARSRDRRIEDNGWNPSVGRNAPKAISQGLAEQGAGWLDTMANFYADPRIDNQGYFDNYRRTRYGYQRSGGQR